MPNRHVCILDRHVVCLVWVAVLSIGSTSAIASRHQSSLGRAFNPRAVVDHLLSDVANPPVGPARQGARLATDMSSSMNSSNMKVRARLQQLATGSVMIQLRTALQLWRACKCSATSSCCAHAGEAQDTLRKNSRAPLNSTHTSFYAQDRLSSSRERNVLQVQFRPRPSDLPVMIVATQREGRQDWRRSMQAASFARTAANGWSELDGRGLAQMPDDDQQQIALSFGRPAPAVVVPRPPPPGTRSELDSTVRMVVGLGFAGFASICGIWVVATWWYITRWDNFRTRSRFHFRQWRERRLLRHAGNQQGTQHTNTQALVEPILGGSDLEGARNADDMAVPVVDQIGLGDARGHSSNVANDNGNTIWHVSDVGSSNVAADGMFMSPGTTRQPPSACTELCSTGENAASNLNHAGTLGRTAVRGCSTDGGTEAYGTVPGTLQEEGQAKLVLFRRSDGTTLTMLQDQSTGRFVHIGNSSEGLEHVFGQQAHQQQQEQAEIAELASRSTLALKSTMSETGQFYAQEHTNSAKVVSTPVLAVMIDCASSRGGSSSRTVSNHSTGAGSSSQSNGRPGIGSGSSSSTLHGCSVAIVGSHSIGSVSEQNGTDIQTGNTGETGNTEETSGKAGSSSSSSSSSSGNVHNSHRGSSGSSSSGKRSGSSSVGSGLASGRDVSLTLHVPQGLQEGQLFRP